MLEKLKLYVLKVFYRFLIVKIDLVDKVTINHYDAYKTFSTLNINTNKGSFSFIFKEDRRFVQHQDQHNNFIGLSSYFIELIPPEGVYDVNNTFKNKVVVMVKLRVNNVNYRALGNLLLDLYIDCFSIR